VSDSYSHFKIIQVYTTFLISDTRALWRSGPGWPSVTNWHLCPLKGYWLTSCRTQHFTYKESDDKPQSAQSSHLQLCPAWITHVYLWPHEHQ